MSYRPFGALNRIFAICLVLSVTACSTSTQKQPSNKSGPSYSDSELLLIERLKKDLPGFYSNFTQIAEKESDEGNTTDLIIRELISQDDPVFLFETQQRNSAIKQYDLYWSQINQQTSQLELKFARLSGNELSTSMPETLNIAKQRALPGCNIALLATGSSLGGQTNPETCQYQNPAQGQMHLYRSIKTNTDELEIGTLEFAPGELEGVEVTPLRFVKHQAYQGEISILLDTMLDAGNADQWQTSTTFTFYDDGRAQYIIDPDSNQLDYTVKLSKLHWRENEPPYLKLDVIQVASGEIQAYSWFKPETEVITFERDWVKVNLERTSVE